MNNLANIYKKYRNILLQYISNYTSATISKSHSMDSTVDTHHTVSD